METQVLQQNAVEDNWQCSKCKKKFTTKATLKRHLRTVCGTKSRLTCNICLKDFTCVEYLKYHRSYYQGLCGPKSRLTCNFCLKDFTREEYFKTHTDQGLCKRPKNKSECELSDIRIPQPMDLQFGGESTDNSLCEYRKASCHICLKCFPCEQDLNEHVKTEHGKDIGVVSSTDCNSIECNKTNFICNDEGCIDQNFPSKKSFRSHLMIHKNNMSKGALSSTDGNSIEYKKTHCICNEEGCIDQNFPSMKSFRSHLTMIHKKDMTKSTHRFSSDRDFNQWKDDLCAKVGVEYYNKYKWKKGNSLNKIYYCRRSGIYRPNRTGKKQLKVQDSCKIGHNCSSSIRLCVTNGVYNVDHFEEHYGHTLGASNLPHTTLPESTKICVAEMLHNKVPRKSIPKMIRENNTMGERSKLIKYQDVLNIEKQYNLKSLQRLRPKDKDLHNIDRENEINTEGKFIKEENNLYSLEFLHPNDRVCDEKEMDDQHSSDDIEGILKQIKEINKSDKISNRLRQIVKTQLTQTLALLNAAKCAQKTIFVHNHI